MGETGQGGATPTSGADAGNGATLSAPIRSVNLLPTGEGRVDEVLGRLRDLAGAGISEQVAIYDEVHRGLAACLVEVDRSPSAGPAGRPG